LKVTGMAEIALADVFVEMADTLVDDFDVMEFLHVLTERCVQLLGISAAGLLLADEQGALQVMAASSERTHLLELFQVQTHLGPCLDCYATGQPVSVPDLPKAGRWPRFTAAAAEVGFAAVHAVPMRLRTQIIGALNFFTIEPGPSTTPPCASAKPSPTSPPSGCCSNAPSTTATPSPDNCSPP
jgi:GAF domain-containing protein